ncbi:hypothetical protein V8E54_015109 [Elaphomyces granulatus]
MVYAVKWFLVTIIISAILSIPMMALTDSVELDSNTLDEAIVEAYNKQYKSLGFWISSWILASWLSACLFHALAQVFPYIFRFVSKYINPAHRRYWKVFRFMKWPITVLGCTIGSYIAYYFVRMIQWRCVDFQDDMKSTVITVQLVIDDILFTLILWAGLYFIEKVIILYITIHYNARSNFGKLQRSKDVISALAELYKTSTYLYPKHKGEFSTDDAIIHNSPHSHHRDLKPVGAVSRFVGTSARGLTSALGYLSSSDEDSHWFEPGSPYAVISTALNHPTSAAALARRIWASLVVQGQDVLNVDDIASALGPYRYQEAQQILAVLDENENGNIKLDEFIGITVETGMIRRDIYAGMHDINHALNTFDWVLLILLGFAMIFFILVEYVPKIEDLRQNISIALVGTAFVISRIAHEFFAGAIFIFFKHNFDVSDHVKLYNSSENNSVACIVKRMSLLYVIFERVDNGMQLQMTNEKLNGKRIENVSKSGLGREKIDLGIDFDTSFKDIQYLRTEISSFLSRKENSRDFRPYLDIRVNSIQDMQKIQIQCSFWHKSNWSNEQLRAARSSKFLCELIRAVRKIPISKPGGSRAKSGEEGRPSYVVTVSEDEAAAKRAAEKKRQQEKRMDHKPPVHVTEEDQSKTERETATANTATAPPKESNQDDEEDALEQLTVIPLAEEIGIPVAGSDNPDGLRQRAPYLFRTGSDQMGMRNVGGPVYSPPFYPPPR